MCSTDGPSRSKFVFFKGDDEISPGARNSVLDPGNAARTLGKVTGAKPDNSDR